MFTTSSESGGTRPATHSSPRPTLAVASTIITTTSTSPVAWWAVSLKRSPSSVRGLWMPGVSTNTTWASGRSRMPRTSVRVVWGLSETIETFEPEDAVQQRRLPDVGPADDRAEPRPEHRRVGHQSTAALDAHPLDAVALHLLDHEAGAVGLDRLAGGRHPAELVEDEAADGVVLLVLRQLEVEPLVDLVDGDRPGTTAMPSAPHPTSGRLDVVLVGDLADQLLEQVLEGDEPGGAAVLVDDDGQVHLLLAHLPQQVGHPLGLRHEPGRAGHLGHGPPAWPSRSARTRSLR